LERLHEYIEKLVAESRTEGLSEFQRQLRQAELANLQFMLNSLLRNRLEKILAGLLDSKTIDQDLLTRPERRFLDQVSRNLRTTLAEADEFFAPTEAKSPSELVVVRFLTDHPQLVGVDLRTYGPFRADDLATLPLENARVIVRKNGAELVAIGASASESSQDT
jgi:DNA replication factor GINS